MKIFISWSGKRSQKFAELLSNFLRELIDDIEPWFSSVKIGKGQRWAKEIGGNLNECNYGIVCLTPENQNVPWIQFESGAISKIVDESSVFPILLCGLRNGDIEGPLDQFQSTVFNKEEMFKLVNQLNDCISKSIDKDVLAKRFSLSWLSFAEKVSRELASIQFEDTSDSFYEILQALQKSELPDPEVAITSFFKAGFEGHLIYRTILSVAKKRLLFFGRKNRKLFDREYFDFFKALGTKNDGNFEFKCLFLNPNSDDIVIKTAHRSTNFKKELTKSINQARTVAEENGIDVDGSFRFYDKNRIHSFIVVDDAILFRPIELDANGRATQLTKASFTLTSVKSSQGQILLSNFKEYWKGGATLGEISDTSLDA